MTGHPTGARMTVRQAAVAAPQMAPTGLEPHGGAVAPSIYWLGGLEADPMWPVVHDEDQEAYCEYGPHPAHDDERPDCDMWVPLGPVPGEPEFDESYWDAKRDDLVE